MKRLISMLLVVTMICSIMPMGVVAEETVANGFGDKIRINFPISEATGANAKFFMLKDGDEYNLGAEYTDYYYGLDYVGNLTYNSEVGKNLATGTTADEPADMSRKIGAVIYTVDGRDITTDWTYNPGLNLTTKNGDKYWNIQGVDYKITPEEKVIKLYTNVDASGCEDPEVAARFNSLNQVTFDIPDGNYQNVGFLAAASWARNLNVILVYADGTMSANNALAIPNPSTLKVEGIGQSNGYLCLGQAKTHGYTAYKVFRPYSMDVDVTKTLDKIMLKSSYRSDPIMIISAWGEKPSVEEMFEKVPSADAITIENVEDAVKALDEFLKYVEDCGYAVSDLDEDMLAEIDAVKIKIEDIQDRILVSGECGQDAYWCLDKDGTLTISGTGATYDWYEYMPEPISLSDEISPAYIGDVPPWYYYVDSIRRIIVNEGIEGIGDYAFQSVRVERISLPQSCVSLGWGYIENSVVENINMPPRVYLDNAITWNSGTGVKIKNLYIDDLASWTCRELWREDASPLPYAENIYVNNERVTEFVIPDGVPEVGMNAFYGCNAMKSVVIPGSISLIMPGAFKACYNLKDVYYDGTAEEWNSINIYGDNDPLLNATIHFAEPEDEFIASGTCGENLTWTLNENGVLTISGEGEMENYSDYSSAPWFDFCFADITEVIIEDGVTTIGDDAFYACYGLTSVEIGDSVTTIGNSAFSNCYSLRNVEIGDSVTTIGERAFLECYSLTSIEIPDSVTTIANYAFECCSNLTSVEIPDSVTTIGERAFLECSSLTSIEIPDSVTTIGNSAFSNCYNLTSIEIPDSVTTIGNSAFSNCYSLTSINVDENNDNYCSIDGNLFDKNKTTIIQYAIGKTNSSYTIPDSVTTIGDFAFESCSSLTSVEIPDSVTTIGDWAFAYCYYLTDVYYNGTENEWSNISIGTENGPLLNATIHFAAPVVEIIASGECGENLTWTLDEDGVLTISGTGEMENYDDYDLAAWYSYKNNIEKVIIEDGVITIGDSAFSNCYSLTSIEIPDSVTTIGNYAFECCSNLTSVEIPDSVTTIGEYAFCHCDSITSIEIPDSVTTIGDCAFYSCDSLTSVVIGDSVTTIGIYAFAYGDSLTSIEIPDSVTTIGYSAFEWCFSLTDVYYNGTETEWGNISIGSYNGPLLNATIHFAEPEVPEPVPGCEPTIYMYATEPNASGVFNVFVALKNNIVPTTNDGSEQLGLASYGLTVEYDKEKFTLNNIAKAGDYSDVPIVNKDVAAAAFSAPSGLCKETMNEETGETTYEYFENTDLLKFYFKINTAAITEEDYGKEFEFKFTSDSSATGHAGATIVFDPTPLMYSIPDTRAPIEGLTATAKTYLVYTGDVIDPSETIELGGSFNADTDRVIEWKSEPAEIKDAGTYKVTAKISRPGSKDTEVSTDVVIGKANTEITIADASITYGETDFAKDFTVAEGVDKAEITVDGYTVADFNAGTKEITATATSANYNVTVKPGVLTINKADTTITITDAEITYGETDFTKDFTVAEGVDKTEITVDGYAVADFNAGTKEITANATSANYNVTVVPGTLTVAKKEVTVIAKNVVQVVCKGMKELTYEPIGLVGEDTLDVTLYLDREYVDEVGFVAAIVVTYADSANYEVVTVNGIYEVVAPTPIDVVISAGSKVYGDAEPTIEYTVAEEFEENIKITREEGENVGEYAYIAELVGLDESEYVINLSFADEKEKFEITKRSATLIVADATKYVGEADPEFTVVVQGLVGEDVLNYSLTREEGENVGEYEIIAMLGENPNYEVTVVSAKLTIKPWVVVEGDALIKLSKVRGVTGHRIEVDVKISGNPGIASMMLKVDYDKNNLKLVDVIDGGKLGNTLHSNNFEGMPYVLSWENDTASENITENGVVATLVFEAVEDAVLGFYPITVSYDNDNHDIFDVNLETVDFGVENGEIELSDFFYGDVNGDHAVNTMDRLILTRYLAKWTGFETIDVRAADVNLDGYVNTLDRAILARHLASWTGYEFLPYRN